MAASLAAPGQRRLTEAWGFRPIAPDQGLALLGEALEHDLVQVGVMPVHWAWFIRQLPQGVKFPFLEAFASETIPEASQPQQSALRHRLEEASSDDERRALLTAHLCSQLGKVLGLSPHEHIEPRQRLFDLGLDSLMAVELKSRLEVSLGCSLSATLVFDYPLVEALVNYLVQEVFPLEMAESAQADSPRDDELEALLTEVDQMSESEVKRHFLNEERQ
jgi:myxalamid-type polyketide synthase MxaB